MTAGSKNEIKSMFEKYILTVSANDTQNKDMTDVITRLGADTVAYERPDGYILRENFIYAIEHFCISMYAKDKNADLSMQAEGSKKHRDKMKDDRDFPLQPSLQNLFDSLQDNLKKHSKNFDVYRESVMATAGGNRREFRLVVLIEDISTSYVVKNHSSDMTPINPLYLSTAAEILLEYQDRIWGVIYVYGDEVDKCLTGCTMTELSERKNAGTLLVAENYAPFEVDRNIHISKDDAAQDKNLVSINLCDTVAVTDRASFEELFKWEGN